MIPAGSATNRRCRSLAGAAAAAAAFLLTGCISFDLGAAAGTDGKPDFTLGIHYTPRPKPVTPEK